MSDKFYGIFQADDATYSNYNTVLQQQQQQQLNQLNQSLLQPGLNTKAAELTTYYGTTAPNTNSITAGSAVAVSNAFDTVNAQSRLIGPNLQYFGGPNNQTNQNQQQQQLLYNSSLMSQPNALTESGAYNIPTSALTLNGSIGVGPNYSCAAAGMSYSFNRNRYMPYSRTTNTTGTTPYPPNSALTLPPHMPRPLSTLPLTTAINTVTQQMYASYQQLSNIYRSYSNLLGAPQLANTAVTSALSVGATTNGPKESVTDKNNNIITDSNRRAAVTLANGGASVTCNPVRRCVSAAVGGTTDGMVVASNEGSANVTAASRSFDVCYGSTSQSITLQITNLDYTMEEASLRNFLMGQLKPITPVLSLVFEGNSYAKVTVPDMFFAKQVVSNLHRKKIGHKRMLVSYTRDSSQTEINTLRCQVAGLLKDVPYYTLPMYKFRELFQARFKTSISVLDLYKMPDICTISVDNSEEKFISLQTSVINSLENSPLMEGLQHSVPYCTVHFKREQHKGWAEQDIEPLPNVWMTISEIQRIIYPLLKNHPGDIPVASLVHCITGQMNTDITPNDNGVNLEHLVCCVQGIQIQVNNFGIKILGWLEVDKESYASYAAPLNASIGATSATSSMERSLYAKSACSASDPLYQISREVIELVKMSPKSTMKFNRFIPAYHNHFGKQCRVADYGYTKLIELFEALASVVQIIGDGENRQITLTHRTQLRRFTSDLLRILRAHGNKSVLLSQLPTIFAQTQNRSFDVTDYGVCDIRDILDGLANSNVVVMSRVQNCDDMLISMPKRKQTNTELEKTILFAGEMVELFRNAPQYTILFQKFVRSYHYHFAYQCRLSDYGFLKLADLMEAIQGVVEMEQTNDEDKKIYLTAKVARRVFAEQCEELVHNVTGNAQTCMKLEEMLQLHKKKYGYQIQPQTLGVSSISEGVELMPYIELIEKEKVLWIICHREDTAFRSQCYRACKLILVHESNLHASLNESSSSDTKENQCKNMALSTLIEEFNKKYEEKLNESTVRAMKHLIEIFKEEDVDYVRSTSFLKFLLSIIRVVEKRTTVLLIEIKSSLHCNITTTFEFGFPNLFSIISAFNDIFVINMGLTQERSEISLQPNCELNSSSSLNRSGLFGSGKSQASKQKAPRSSRLPLSENNNSRSYSLQGPPTKTRALSNANENNNYQTAPNYKGKVPSSAIFQPASKTQRSTATKPKSQPLQQHTQSQQQQQQVLQAQQQMQNIGYESKNLSAVGTHMSYNGNTSIYSVASHNSSLNTSGSISAHSNDNLSFGALNSALNSSNLSLSDLNVSQTQLPMQAATTTSSQAQMSGTTKLWDRRHAAAIASAAAASMSYQQQAMMSENVSGLPSLIMSTAESDAMNGNRQHHQQLQQQQNFQTVMEQSMAAVQPKIKQDSVSYIDQTNLHMYPMFEPPKPDTPPSNNMPFWIDPIWSHNTADSEAGQTALLNIRLPELKSFNVLPMVLSPYTLSKAENMKQKVFNFENHDRKIA
ncbi:meiosis regulator and mRNA stability factor 1 [Bactrocera dorsalis]|uniref:Meiosis regulator and mRNA stability factor 1 n=1 Tax=Bactrocera dorsalis TaxID=27457 RepID=A0ABM3IZM6_BACDO|nr:meiosis regulator and mRNA stability factor 1 [Bactrocera dorsalis]